MKSEMLSNMHTHVLIIMSKNSCSPAFKKDKFTQPLENIHDKEIVNYLSVREAG